MDSLDTIIKFNDTLLRVEREKCLLELITNFPLRSVGNYIYPGYSLKDDNDITEDLLGMLDPGQRSKYL